MVGKLVIAVVVFNSPGGLTPYHLTASARQQSIVVVRAEQPNLWTLEQAHYLLAQTHRRNLDLKAKSLEELDPNEIAGLRFDLMRMLIEFGATFNQADLEADRLFSSNRTFNSGRRRELLAERDRLRRDALNLTGEIEELETEKAGTASPCPTRRPRPSSSSKTRTRGSRPRSSLRARPAGGSEGGRRAHENSSGVLSGGD